MRGADTVTVAFAGSLPTGRLSTVFVPVTVDVLVVVPGVVIVVVQAYVHDSPTSSTPLPLASPPV